MVSKSMKYRVEFRFKGGVWSVVRNDIESLEVAMNVCQALCFSEAEARIVRVIEEMIAAPLVSPLVANYHAGA